jgi:hypothetical protein
MSKYGSLYYGGYGVFCMAIAMGGESWELDKWWESAVEHYDNFLESEYNDENQSELDGIINYVKSIKQAK